MEKHLFLTGPTGCGKTTLLRRALGGRLAEAGGLVTQARCGVHGELTGFALSPAASAAGIPGFTPETYLDCTRFPPRADTEVWRGTGVRLLEEARWYPYALLDELGGFEQIVPQFLSALEALLRTDLPVIGALLPTSEALSLRQALELGEKADARFRALRRLLEEDPNARIVEVSGPDDPRAADALRDWVSALP